MISSDAKPILIYADQPKVSGANWLSSAMRLTYYWFAAAGRSAVCRLKYRCMTPS